MTPGYNFDEEARIVCEAIGSNNGRMTVHCALREAHAAGAATQGAEIARLRTALETANGLIDEWLEAQFYAHGTIELRKRTRSFRDSDNQPPPSEVR